jgi:hypothetical protein
MRSKRQQDYSTQRLLTLKSEIVLVGLSVLVASVSGCGSGRLPTYPAGGQVKLANGLPMTRGWVEFESIKETPTVSARGDIQPDGTFELGTYQPGDGAIEGPHRVAVGTRLAPGELDNPKLRKPSPIDPHFSDINTSGLQFNVTRDADKNRFEIVVQPPSAERSN